MLVCLKMLVVFLICGDEYVKVDHFVPLLEGVGWGEGFRKGVVLLYFES